MRLRARHAGRLLGVAVCALLAAAPLTAQEVVDRPPGARHRAVTILPPGQSGFVNAEGQVRGQASGGDPGAYGEHLDDQREPYWNFDYKDGSFFAGDEAEQPKPGVRIYRDDFGVPAIYADTGRDVWFGVGYAIAQDRLFLMDAVRRMGRGTFAELTGPSGVPGDIQQRTLTYSEAEYDRFFARLSQEAQDSITGYVDGANAWRRKAVSDPRLLPAEYALLSTTPEPFTVHDVLAGGVLITRTVAADGGNEFENVRALRRLQAKFGKRKGRGIFRDLVWQEDPKATVTVPGKSFSNQGGSAARRAAAFEAMADYAQDLPLALEEGLGTGAAPQPSPGDAPADVPLPEQPAAVAAAVEALNELRAGLHGGSYSVAVDGSKTASGKPMLVSGPQLGYSYPSLLVELEIHGAGYDARGVSVPGLPTVGIGYNQRVAWALTTGYSKTIDSFIETTRDGAEGAQYRHDGRWKNEQCRTETIKYRQEVEGLPVGPAVFERDVEVCRTVHGPVVARTNDGTQARSVQYAMFKRELETIEGILQWNKARNFDDFAAGVADVTWNENVTYAGADGRIGYWHPGLYPRRDPDGDQRFPLPGTGEFDHRGILPFDRMPSAADPQQGFLANWNNKPARGWYDGEGISPTSRPAGEGARVTSLRDRLRRADDLTFGGLQRLEQQAGLTDHRAREYVPLLEGLLDGDGLTERQREALRLIAAWDGIHFSDARPVTADDERTDPPAATIFNAVVLALRGELLGDVPPSFLARQSAMGSHVYDVSAADNLVLRVLDPTHSGLEPTRDYTGGRSANQVLKAALREALADLEQEYGSGDLADYRRPHPRSDVCSLTGGVIGPCLTMPYQDRGSWIHVVDFGQTTPGGGNDGDRTDEDTTDGGGAGGVGDAGGDRAPSLPATGSRIAAIIGLAALILGLMLWRGRR